MELDRCVVTVHDVMLRERWLPPSAVIACPHSIIHCLLFLVINIHAWIWYRRFMQCID